MDLTLRAQAHTAAGLCPIRMDLALRAQTRMGLEDTKSAKLLVEF